MLCQGDHVIMMLSLQLRLKSYLWYGCHTTSLTGALIAVSEPNGGHRPYSRYGNLVIKVLAISLLNTVNTRLATESYHSITESSHIVTLENIKIAYDNILSHLARVRLVARH